MKCSFCNTDVRHGTGKMFVKADGTMMVWCSSKCENNFKMGRLPKKLKWAHN